MICKNTQLELLKLLIFFYLKSFASSIAFVWIKNLDYYLSSIHLLCHFSIVTQYCRVRVCCVAPGKDAVPNDCSAFYVKYTSLQCNTTSLHQIHVNTTHNYVTHTS